MRGPIVLHVVAGGVGIVTGYVALAVAKGGTAHRRAGLAFTWAMLAMASSAWLVAAAKRQPGNLVAATLTLYLVATATLAVRPAGTATRRVERGAMVVALLLGLTSAGIGVDLLASGRMARGGVPAPIFLLFGVVALLGGIGDLRMLRAGGVAGVARLRRHLWRMCFSLWIAAMSFFIGQARHIPEPLRIYPLLALPGLVALLAMAYWAWRTRRRGPARGTAALGVNGAR